MTSYHDRSSSAVIAKYLVIPRTNRLQFQRMHETTLTRLKRLGKFIQLRRMRTDIQIEK